MTSRIFPATFALLLLPAAAAAQPAGAEAEAELAVFAPALAEQVPVQYVFLGYAAEEIDAAAFLAQLPAQARPVVRSRLWYNVNEEVGLHYGYDHRVSFAPPDYQDAFFAALAALARPAPPTEYQRLYNAQERNLLEVVDNHFIDAPAVERWLIDHPPPGVDTRRNTIFFINWHGRPDFRFHVYTKTGEVDPDTGHDFGGRETRKIIAWGGTTADDGETGLGARGEHRIWFYDLSAGPEAWTDNWNVDSPDLDGDGEVEYRMPPSWEYGLAGGFRPRAALAADLGKVARYVGINLLFTPSPLYPPALTPLGLPATVNLDSNTFEGWPGVDASVQYQKPARLLGAIRDLHRLPYQQDQQDLAYEGQGRECHRLWLANVRCFPARPYPAFSNPFLYTALNRTLLLDGGGEYEAILVNYATADGRSDLLGYADDNAIDGTQSFVFSFVSPAIVEAGYGLTTTQIHEFGHHLGMSHPHDGYDSATGVEYNAEGAFYFANSGDEVNSIMSYIDLNWDFSQFDRDNQNRFQAAAYLTNARAIVKEILARLGPQQAARNLVAAALQFKLARVALQDHDYAATFDHARLGFERTRTAAEELGVPVAPGQNGWLVLPEVTDPDTSIKVARRYSFEDRLDRSRHRARGN